MIMYELSALLCGIRKECSGAFKKKIIMSGYRNTSVNTDFYWLTMLSLSEYEHSECEVAAKAFFNISRISRKNCVTLFFSVSFLQVLQTGLKNPPPGSRFCLSAHLAESNRLDQYQVKLSVSASTFTCHSGAMCRITNALEV